MLSPYRRRPTINYTFLLYRVYTTCVAALDVVVGARKHVLYEGVQPGIVAAQFNYRVDRVVKSVGGRCVRVRVEIALNTFALQLHVNEKCFNSTSTHQIKSNLCFSSSK